jgi:predicted CXXCH cytochrome family protein
MRLTNLALAALVAVALQGCTNEEIVYRDKPLFNPPPDSLNGFLGYFTASTKQTTCGNCHVGVQADWAQTAHSHAWTDLQNSGHASASCNKCHTVSELGNAVGHPAGYSTVPDTAYHDVQCESCHGPGFTHVENPDIEANHPLAHFHVDTGVVASCAGCHTGAHTPYVEQWKQSGHGSGPGFANAGTNPSCMPCHEGRTAMTIKFGVQTRYVEQGSATPERINCVTCHSPHGSPYESQLRAPLSTPTRDQLCVTCHSRSGVPPWSVASGNGTSRGPHGAQGLLVLGENVGWIPPDFAYDTTDMASSHGTSANPRLCATCHVVRQTITDNITGAFQFQSVGHTFDAIMCKNTAGIPTPCADVPDTTAAGASGHDFTACSTSGCHIGGPTQAANAYRTLKGELNNYLDQIWTDVNHNGVIDSAGIDNGLVPQLVSRALRPGATAADSAPINFRTNVTTVAKGTLWNAALAATEERRIFLNGVCLGNTFSTHMASGNGVHNPFLLKALLLASIATMHSEYGLPSPPVPNTLTGTVPPHVRLRAGAGGATQ